MANEIRFAVGCGNDLRSSVWRLWAKGDDLCIAARSLAGTLKISFRKSEKCRFALVSTTPRPAIAKWQRPPKTIHGVTRLFAIVIPPIHVRRRFIDKLPPPEKPTVLIPTPKIDSSAVFSILLTDPDWTEERLLKLPSSTRLSCHGCVHLKREIAWLISFYQHFKMDEVKPVMNLIATAKISLKHGSKKENIDRAFLHALELGKDGPLIVDVWLGPDNIYVDTK